MEMPTIFGELGQFILLFIDEMNVGFVVVLRWDVNYMLDALGIMVNGGIWMDIAFDIWSFLLL